MRTRGTIGGSLAHADPTGEMALAALALDATIVVQSPTGTREIAARDFFLGPYFTVLEPADMIVEVRFPHHTMVTAFAEHARRHGDFCVISVAALGEPDGDAGWKTVRLAVGGASYRPFVADEASAALSNTALEPDAVEAAGAACVEAAEPSDDIRASADYRAHLLPIYVRRVLDADEGPKKPRSDMTQTLIDVRLTVNGEPVERAVEPRRSLVDFLRHDLGLTGTHVGCEQGVCGMCTVLLDGEPIKSCIMLAVQADGAEITTIESLNGEELHPAQRAFKEAHGLQCGYCTPAFILTSVALRERGLDIPREELKEELAGVLCRCTGYQNILTAVETYLAADD